MRISVIGLGRLGLVHAAALASLGHTVVGVEANTQRVRKILDGTLEMHEPGLVELVRTALTDGTLDVTGEPSAARGACAHFLTVGTPELAPNEGFDPSYLENALRSLVPSLQPGDLVIGKSTVPPGTAAALAAQLHRESPGAELAWNPEFLAEGTAVRDTLAPHRLIYGVSSLEAARLLDEVYAPILDRGTQRVITDLATAELVKLATNAFLATKISFINTIAQLAATSGADALQTAQLLGADPRIGASHLNPGLGYGGGCLPKDTRGLAHYAQHAGAIEAAQFFTQVDTINAAQRQHIAEWVIAQLSGRQDSQVAILGASFKAETDDIRESPSIALAHALMSAGLRVRIADPVVTASRGEDSRLEFVRTAEEAMREADVTLVATAWPEYRRLNPAALLPMVRRPLIVDTRHCLDSEDWRNASWDYRSMFNLSLH